MFHPSCKPSLQVTERMGFYFLFFLFWTKSLYKKKLAVAKFLAAGNFLSGQKDF